MTDRWRFPNSLWVWLLLFFATYPLVWATFFYLGPTHGSTLSLTLVSGESSVGFWTKLGYPFLVGWLIATLCGNYDLLIWFCCGNWIERQWGQTVTWLSRIPFLGRIFIEICYLGEMAYRRFVPQPLSLRANEVFAKDYHAYIPLLIYGFWPGGIWVGIAYVIALNLDQRWAFIVIATANALKMLVFGSLSFAINPWLMLAVNLLLLPRMKRLIQTYLRSALTRTVILQVATTTPQ